MKTGIIIFLIYFALLAGAFFMLNFHPGSAQLAILLLGVVGGILLIICGVETSHTSLTLIFYLVGALLILFCFFEILVFMFWFHMGTVNL